MLACRLCTSQLLHVPTQGTLHAPEHSGRASEQASGCCAHEPFCRAACSCREAGSGPLCWPHTCGALQDVQLAKLGSIFMTICLLTFIVRPAGVNSAALQLLTQAASCACSADAARTAWPPAEAAHHLPIPLLALSCRPVAAQCGHGLCLCRTEGGCAVQTAFILAGCITVGLGATDHCDFGELPGEHDKKSQSAFTGAGPQLLGR